MPAGDARLATRPTCSSSSPTSRNHLSLGNLPHNFFLRPQLLFLLFSSAYKARPSHENSYHLSVLCAPGWIFLSHFERGMHCAALWNATLGSRCHRYTYNIYNTGAQAQQTGTNSSYTFFGSTLSCERKCPDDVQTSRILAFRRLPLSCKANPRRKQIFSIESHLNGTSEGLSPMAT